MPEAAPVCFGLTFPKKKAILTPTKEVKSMKKNSVLDMLYQLASPIAVILLGLLLVINPDSASILIARIVGWILTLTGIGFGIAAILDREHAIRKGAVAVLFACVGGTLSAKPLLLAAFIGRIIGVLIVSRGIRDLMISRSYGYSRILALITTAAGAVLVVLPLTTSRLVFSVCGLVVLFIGIGMLADRLKHRRYLHGGDNNIIDAL